LLGGASDVIFVTIITIGANGYKYDGDDIEPCKEAMPTFRRSIIDETMSHWTGR
jgi:hypothetical protein